MRSLIRAAEHIMWLRSILCDQRAGTNGATSTRDFCVTTAAIFFCWFCPEGERAASRSAISAIACAARTPCYRQLSLPTPAPLVHCSPLLVV